MSRYGIFPFHFLYRRTSCVDFYLAATIFAAQEIIVIRFETGPADLGHAGNAILPFEPFQVFFVDLADVAEDLCGHIIVRIVTDWLHVDRNPRQIIMPFFYLRYDILCQILGKHSRFEGILTFFHFFLEFCFGHLEDLRQRMQLIVSQFFLCRHVRNHKARPGANENLAVPVVHDTAHGRNRNGPQAVAIGQAVIVIAFKELQIHEPANQRGKDEYDDPIEVAKTPVLVLFFH